MKPIRSYVLAGLLLLPLLTFFGCDKSDERGTSELTVKMVDAPIEMDAVYVEVLEVKVNYDDTDKPEGYEGWTALSTEAGIYDLLELRNGVSAVLTENESIPSGKVSQIRLVLGNQNSVVVGGVTHPLQTPSAESSGLKINVHQELEPDHTYEITLDFDANQSVVTQGNGGYSLNPVITVESVVVI